MSEEGEKSIANIIAYRSMHTQLLCREAFNSSLELRFSKDLVSLIRCDLSELDIALIKLLLHDLLENLESKGVCLSQGHLLIVSKSRALAYFVIQVLQRLLGSIRSGSDSLSLVAHKRSRWVSVEQLWALLVASSNQESNTKWTGLASALQTTY